MTLRKLCVLIGLFFILFALTARIITHSLTWGVVVLGASIIILSVGTLTDWDDFWENM
jgi:hypothetical protein